MLHIMKKFFWIKQIPCFQIRDSANEVFCKIWARYGLLCYTYIMAYSIQQTHFIGIPIPDNIAVMLEQCRAWMREQYGCKSGQTTPLHITLVPPFHLDKQFAESDMHSAMNNAVQTWTSRGKQLMCVINGFGAFSTRTIFAHVETASPQLQSDNGNDLPRAKDEWTALRTTVYNALLSTCPGTARRDARIFTPHITIANRDIPPAAIPDALTYLDALGVHESFDVRQLTIFARRGTWIADSVFAW